MASSYAAKRVVGLLVVVGILATAQLLLMEPESTPIWQALFDSGHALLYGLVSLIVLALLDTLWPTWRRSRRYLESFGIAMVAGTVMEGLQSFGPREPQVIDLLRNALGSVAFLAVVASHDSSALPDAPRPRLWARVGLHTGAALALVIAFVPVILAAGAIVARDRAFPSLCGFDTVWERQLVFVNETADIEYRPSGGASRGRGGSAAYVTYRPGRHSILTLYDPYPDWTSYENLSFMVRSELAEPVRLTLWIEDDHHHAGIEGWFSRKLTIEPGENQFTIPLETIRTTAKKRKLDLRRIHKISLYGSRVETTFSLTLDDFRLQ